MKYHIVLETRARKDYLGLPARFQENLRDAIDDLGTNPRPPGSKKLSGIDGYRLRQGAYRILYTIDDKTRQVRIYKIGHRREVYRH